MNASMTYQSRHEIDPPHRPGTRVIRPAAEEREHTEDEHVRDDDQVSYNAHIVSENERINKCMHVCAHRTHAILEETDTYVPRLEAAWTLACNAALLLSHPYIRSTLVSCDSRSFPAGTPGSPFGYVLHISAISAARGAHVSTLTSDKAGNRCTGRKSEEGKGGAEIQHTEIV